MCCHEHPDNGHGLALERVGSVPSSPWTLKDLRELNEHPWYENEGDNRSVAQFLKYLEAQND
jgi:hypothetical protein